MTLSCLLKILGRVGGHTAKNKQQQSSNVHRGIVAHPIHSLHPHSQFPLSRHVCLLAQPHLLHIRHYNRTGPWQVGSRHANTLCERYSRKPGKLTSILLYWPYLGQPSLRNYAYNTPLFSFVALSCSVRQARRVTIDEVKMDKNDRQLAPKV